MSDDAIRAVIDALSEKGVDFMVVGSLASNFYGIPRSTQDADIVVELGGASISEIVRDLGPRFRFDPQRSFETTTMTHKYLIDVPDLPFRFELFLLSDDPFDQSRFARRKSVPMHGGVAFVATSEDMIVQKLRWARPKDLDDALNMLSVQKDNLDWSYINLWCNRHGTSQLLAELRAKVK